MSCYHMNVISVKKNSLIRKDGQIADYTERFIGRHSPDFKGYEFYIKENERLKAKGEPYEYKFIPCGVCIGCRAEERKNWALRIELEAKKYKHNYFLTLTYDNNHINIPETWISPKTGEEFYNDGSWTGTLIKEDLTRFMKSIRKWFERDYFHTGTKFYAVGEYGERTQRPHYHILLLNCPELELKPIGDYNRKTINAYYTNERIEKIWGKGFIQIGSVTWESISYTAGYTMKKLFGEVKDEYYAQRGQLPIFAQMSRNPGIAKDYWNTKGINIYDYDEIINSKGQSMKPPRYFDKQLDKINHDYAVAIKKIRAEKNKNETAKRLKVTDIPLAAQYAIEEETAKAKQRAYNRGRIK